MLSNYRSPCVSQMRKHFTVMHTSKTVFHTLLIHKSQNIVAREHSEKLTSEIPTQYREDIQEQSPIFSQFPATPLFTSSNEILLPYTRRLFSPTLSHRTYYGLGTCTVWWFYVMLLNMNPLGNIELWLLINPSCVHTCNAELNWFY